MISTHDYKPNSPGWVMARFFNCWKRRAWVQMLAYVQPSWLVQHEEPNRVLRLSLHTLVDAEFVQINAETGITTVFLVNIDRKSSYHRDQSVKAVRLVREGKKWGIDPKSII